MKGKQRGRANDLVLGPIRAAAEVLTAQGRELRARHDKDSLASAKALKELQMEVAPLVQLPFRSTDRFLLFFLSLYIEDVFANILTDTPYSEAIKEARAYLLEQIGSRLKRLASAYRRNDEMKLYETCKELVQVYLDKIDELNLREKETM
jgi:hypothetical protein